MLYPVCYSVHEVQYYCNDIGDSDFLDDNCDGDLWDGSSRPASNQRSELSTSEGPLAIPATCQQSGRLHQGSGSQGSSTSCQQSRSSSTCTQGSLRSSGIQHDGLSENHQQTGSAGSQGGLPVNPWCHQLSQQSCSQRLSASLAPIQAGSQGLAAPHQAP